MKKTRAQSNLRKHLRYQKNDRKACRNFFAAQKKAAELGSAWCDRQGANKRGEKTSGVGMPVKKSRERIMLATS